MSSSRFDALTAWTAERHGLPTTALTLSPAGGDASFRGYFRLTLPEGENRMLMDAPPEQEDSQTFIAIAERWRAAGLAVPIIYAHDLTQGFIELQDLGETPLQNAFKAAEHPDTLARHSQALAVIAALQNRADPSALPAYDAALLGRELDLFPDWCLNAWLGIDTPDSWPAVRKALIETALSQPVVSVHRDFDAMNLMLFEERLYMIDFQDAVAGPISYDLISLLRGRYCRFSPETFSALVGEFYHQARRDGRLAADINLATFEHQTQAMAAQRSLKVLGIFCRLTLRDHKTGYLWRLPHFLDHLENSLATLPAHSDFLHWVRETLRPALSQRLSREDVQ
ncbi:phosphotransferase [Vreelandella rituensis]|uniref:Aminoglycoside phosphotransferase n=1 Tax=Vreelandella rituensis TaxID=2282306 RepID=A0A368U9P0_9GAMM|nr:phosphotransferase [Halomonas rituensis]RCV93206.1 aminoglycoside phosphotransferase [Halomonas rituensis]